MTDTIPKILTVKSFMEKEWTPPHTVTFSWETIDGEDVLNLRPKGIKWDYPIEMYRVKSPLSLINWIDHLLEKEWFNGDDAKELIRLVCEKKGGDHYAAG